MSNKVDTIPHPGKPLLILHGSSVAGAVKVRYPSRHDRYMMRRNLKRGGADLQAGGRQRRHTGDEDRAGHPAAHAQDAPPQDEANHRF